MSKQETILRLLSQGKVIRVMDGRCGNGFVDRIALQKLIDDGRVTVYNNGGMEFVKAKVTK